MRSPASFGWPPLFRKPLVAITPEDVREMVEMEIAESDSVEFKERLPAKKGETDPWELGQSRIGERARNELLEEIAGFTNSHGGHLVLGIEESDDHPRRAVGIRPVRDCADFAHRLLMQARDCLDPQIPLLEIWPVVTEENGAGVVLVRVPESQLAPHRVMPTLKCSARRSDRTQAMTMREIQDLTLQRAAAADALDAAFAERAAQFVEFVRLRHELTNFDWIALRATAIPTTRAFRVPRAVIGTLEPLDERFQIGSANGVGQLHGIQMHTPSWQGRPILRGRRFTDQARPHGTLQVEIFERGVVDLAWIQPAFGGSRLTTTPPQLMMEHVLAAVANVACTAHALRAAGGAPSAEYAVEAELASGYPITLSPIGVLNGKRIELAPNPLRLPRYSFGAFDEMPALIGLVAADLLNSAGVPCEPGRYDIRGPEKRLAELTAGAFRA